jgi:hypothetical protein
MLKTLIEGLSLIDATGLTILGATITTLVLAIVMNLWLRSRYAAIGKDLVAPRAPEDFFDEPVLRRIVEDATVAVQRSSEANTQAIIEDRFATDLRPMLLAERFVRAATGLVIILGLLGTFYGLTLSIGRIVQLVAVEAAPAVDINQGVSQGLTRALSGMSVAFSNSLVGVLSAVILTVVGILSSIPDRRAAVMLQIETYLERALVRQPRAVSAPAVAGESFARLDTAVGRFEAALQGFATNTRDFREFNAHLKDNIARLSLAFGDLSDTLKTQVGGLRQIPPRG